MDDGQSISSYEDRAKAMDLTVRASSPVGTHPDELKSFKSLYEFIHQALLGEACTEQLEGTGGKDQEGD